MRATARDAARRTFVGASRATVRKANDKPLMKETDLDVLYSEGRVDTERFQQYGLTTVPLPEDKKTGKAAEALMVHLGGNRSHSVIVAVDDRRYRLKVLKEGEVALYDDQGQQVHLTRDGIVMSTVKGKKIVSQVVDPDKKKQGEYGTKPAAEKTPLAKFTMTHDSFTIDAKTVTVNSTNTVINATQVARINANEHQVNAIERVRDGDVWSG